MVDAWANEGGKPKTARQLFDLCRRNEVFDTYTSDNGGRGFPSFAQKVLKRIPDRPVGDRKIIRLTEKAKSA